MIRIAVVALLIVGCSKKTDDAAKSAPVEKKSASGLAWEPVGLEKLSAICKKTLACCEEIVKADKPAATAEDYNEKCSGPALWKDPDCEMDLKSRITVLESGGKPVPGACK